MGWILLILLILDWIIMFFKLFKGIEELEHFEKTKEGNPIKNIKQFLFCLFLGIVITLILLAYSALQGIY